MKEYWESKFKAGGAAWDFIPADSAVRALDIFSANGLKHILIPGFGYGRNAGIFISNGLEVTGIEISETAIGLAAKNGINCTVHPGSVTKMPFDDKKYDGIFCYALIHLLNNRERNLFLRHCFDQLKNKGIMIFVVASVQMSLYGTGKLLSKNRFELTKGLEVFFYDSESVTREFLPYGLISYEAMDEPVKFMAGQDPIKMIFVVCKKEN